jgi:hypothetical protein
MSQASKAQAPRRPMSCVGKDDLIKAGCLRQQARHHICPRFAQNGRAESSSSSQEEEESRCSLKWTDRRRRQDAKGGAVSLCISIVLNCPARSNASRPHTHTQSRQNKNRFGHAAPRGQAIGRVGQAQNNERRRRIICLQAAAASSPPSYYLLIFLLVLSPAGRKFPHARRRRSVLTAEIL